MKKISKLVLCQVTKKELTQKQQGLIIGGGACRAWLCDCSNPNLVAQTVDNILEEHDLQSGGTLGY